MPRVSHLDVRSALPLVVQSLDDNEHSVLDPCLEQLPDLRSCGLVVRVEFESGGDGVSCPVFGLGILAPASGGDCSLDSAEVGRGRASLLPPLSRFQETKSL